MTRFRLVAVIALVVFAAAAASTAQARSPLPTIVQDDAVLLHGSEEQVAAALDQLVSLRVDIVRMTASWHDLTRDPDATTRPDIDLADPQAYDEAAFRNLDRAITLADARGLPVMLDAAFYAPRWATIDDPAERRPRRIIDGAAFGAFAGALARRYDGTFGGLPRVATFTLWNEPNHPAFLAPQWRRRGGRWVPASPDIYRPMVRAGYAAIKAAQPRARVLIGATAPRGSYAKRGTGVVPPLRFLRELACVNRQLRPLRRRACRGFSTLPGDGWAHHPYSLQTLPSVPTQKSRRDDVPLGSIGRLTALLGALVREGRLAPGLADTYITEYGYESAPPSRLEPWTIGDQARFLPWSEYLAWRNPHVRSFGQFLLRDTPPGERVSASLRRPFGEWGSGLLFSDGGEKPAAQSFRAGLFVRRAADGRVRIWGRIRVGDGRRRVKLQVQSGPGKPWRALVSRASDGRGRELARFFTDRSGVLQRVARAPSGRRYRVVVLAMALTGTSVRAVVG